MKTGLLKGKNFIYTMAGVGSYSLLYVIFMAFLAVYGWKNPDPANCFFIDGLDAPALTKELITEQAAAKGVAVRPGYPIDMGHLFRSWFVWGFWGSIFTVAILAAAIPLHIYMVEKRNMIHLSSALCLAISLCNSSAWFILGLFWRFSQAGRVAAGEKLNKSAADWLTASKALGYQINGGKFMSVYIWLILTIFLIAIIFGSVYAVILCRKSDAED